MTILVVVVVVFLFCSKLVEFFHVAFISVEKYCPVLFFAGFIFLRNNVRKKKKHLPSRHLFVKRETNKKSFVFC